MNKAGWHFTAAITALVVGLPCLAQHNSYSSGSTNKDGKGALSKQKTASNVLAALPQGQTLLQDSLSQKKQNFKASHSSKTNGSISAYKNKEELQTEKAIQIPEPTASYSVDLATAVEQYQTTPGDDNYQLILKALAKILNSPNSMKLSAVALVQQNPCLASLSPKVIGTSTVRVWSFLRTKQKNKVLVQWCAAPPKLVGTGKHKHIVSTGITHLQILLLENECVLSETGLVYNKGGSRLIIAGNTSDGALIVQAFKLLGGLWQEDKSYFDLPSFLTKDVCGHVTFRGSDLIFNVGRLVLCTDSTGIPRRLPEAESNTYKFLVKLKDNGYSIITGMPDQEDFLTVIKFMQAVQSGREDIYKTFLADTQLACIPKYLGLTGNPLNHQVRVVQMCMPADKGHRYRLINLGKDDLIFDVGKIKEESKIKAIFIAEPEPFLQETAKYFLLYTKLCEDM